MAEYSITIRNENLRQGTVLALDEIAARIAGVEVIGGDPSFSIEVEATSEGFEALQNLFNETCLLEEVQFLVPLDHQGWKFPK